MRKRESLALPRDLPPSSPGSAPWASRIKFWFFLICEDNAKTLQPFLPQVQLLRFSPRWLRVPILHHLPPVPQSLSQSPEPVARHQLHKMDNHLLYSEQHSISTLTAQFRGSGVEPSFPNAHRMNYHLQTPNLCLSA